MKNKNRTGDKICKKKVSITIYRKNVLDRYFDRGFLDMQNSKFSAEDRKKAGEMLAYDFYMGQYGHIQSREIRVVNIPSTGGEDGNMSLYYRERYIQAAKSIPHEFWPAVRRVCIEDKTLRNENEEIQSRLQNKNSIYFQKMLLNLGLDRLIQFYLKKNKKSS